MGQQEKELKEQIKHLEEQVKKTTPDPTHLKELKSTVTKYSKGNPFTTSWHPPFYTLN